MSQEIHIIGLGVAHIAALPTNAISALEECTCVMGSQRQIDTVCNLMSGQKILMLPPLNQLKTQLAKLQDEGHVKIAILASGDPLYYGIGKWISSHVSTARVNTYPAVSSIQAACHAVGRSLQDVDVVSLHGRPFETLKHALKPNKTLVVLTDKNSMPMHIATACQQLGFHDAKLTICERMGYEDEKIRSFTVEDLLPEQAQHASYEREKFQFDLLNVAVVETYRSTQYVPTFPGIPDNQFYTDGTLPGKGMLTKRAVRLQILSMLEPQDEDVIWDIGAGCGSVSIELGAWNSKVKVHAIEHHSDRLECIYQNRFKFGVSPQLNIVEGKAPNALNDLPPPNKIFVGGSDGELGAILKIAWSDLQENGILLGSAVTESTKMGFLTFLEAIRSTDQIRDIDFTTITISIAEGGTLAGQLLYRPNLPVTLFQFRKCVTQK